MLKNKMLRVLLIVLIVINASVSVYGEEVSYTYSIWEQAVPAPQAYQIHSSVHAVDLNIENLRGIKDLFYRNKKLYIAANNCIIVIDEEFNHLKTISSESLIAPSGVFVTTDDQIYVADPEKGVILHFDEQYELIRILEKPDIIGLEGIRYQPMKVVVDDTGRIYTLAKNIYEGIIELNPDGRFNRFIGADKVKVSPLDIFWRSIATEEQIAQMTLWLPTDYSDITLDKDDFILATVQGGKVADPVRRLNAKGVDIMREYPRITRPSGDVNVSGGGSNITSVACSEDGRFAILDSSRSKIFVYNEEARLLYVLGGSGSSKGQFMNPIDLIFMDEKILVADSVSASIEVFEPTEYGAYINEATYYQSMYKYNQAAPIWEKVVAINPNFDYAYVGIGKQEIRNKDYDSAVESFYTARDIEYYSSSYAKVREKTISDNFEAIIGILLLIILIVLGIKLLRTYCRKKGWKPTGKIVDCYHVFKEEFIRFPLYILSHPFKGFYDIKYEKRGNNKVCISILMTLVLINIIRFTQTSFMIKDNNLYEMNSLLLIFGTICPYLLFISANWSITTLIDGKGTFENIFRVNMYALYPKIFLDLFGILISNVLTLEEVPVALFFFGLSTFLYCFYLFIGLVMMHDFSFFKCIWSILLTFVAMGIIVFIILLLVTLVGGFINDIYTIIYEFTLLF